MQIVIEISEERYKDIQRIAEVQTEKRMLTCEQIIANGTPLPKGHGRLIDANDLIQELSVVSSRPIKSQLYILREAPTIIEADKAESGG